ncbi:hypothetical protein [Consotaella aegiceratis]|uniref:hypothetical protein n=1 Tax=Consotaella aegiceratis TaxID=3097961 RepID=UPI002F3E4928
MKIVTLVAAGALLSGMTAVASADELITNSISDQDYTLVHVSDMARFSDNNVARTTTLAGAQPTGDAIQRQIQANAGLGAALQARGVDLGSIEALDVLPGNVVYYVD